MNRTEKSGLVTELSRRLAGSPSLYVTDFTGLKVKHMTELRRKLRGVGVSYVVVKNTLALRALDEARIAGLADVLEGPTGLVFAGADPVAAAKVLSDFYRDHQQPTVKAGLLEGRRVTSQELTRLATLPSRDALLAQVAGAFQAPLQGLVGAMNGLLYQWVGALEALKAQRGDAA